MRPQSRRKTVARAHAFIALGLGACALSEAALACPSSSAARPWLDTSLSAECRADALLVKLTTLEQKLDALGFGLGQYGIEAGGASDGPAGPTRAPGAAALPNGLALAASFDTALAAEYGTVMGREFRAAGVRRMLGPTVDIARTWRHGRVPEALGEDPLLAAHMAVPLVAAVQKQGVATTLKHFAVYTQDQGRTGDLPFGLHPAVNNVLSERVMREVYLPPFRAAVEEGGALGVMCAFPRINGVYACEHPLLLGILKNEWGMRGTVSPDFPNAQRSVVAAVNAGLDSGNFGLPRPPRPTAQSEAQPAAQEGQANAPAGPPTGADLGAALGVARVPGGIDLKTAVSSGQVSEARLNDMIRRKLITIFAVDTMGPAQSDQPALGGEAARAFGLRVAEQSAVLLRNEPRVLPLGAGTKSIAVIGAQAGANAQRATTGSAFIESQAATSIIDAIKTRAGTTTIAYEPGSLALGALPTVPMDVLQARNGAQGLDVEYFANHALRFEGQPLHAAVDPQIDIRTPAPIPGLPAHNGWSVRWTGTLVPRTSGLHNFTIAGAGSARLFLDDELVAHFDRVDFGTVAYATATLERGRSVALRVEFTPREAAPLPAIQMLGTTLGTLMNFGWAEPDDRIARAVDAARKADVAVVFAADSHGEGADRTTLALPGDQDLLIASVAAANPKTVVVLNTAGAVAMPWASQVAAILQLWYPGDALGTASARLLFGDAAPQGRLPITFPVDEAQGPATLPRNYPGTVDATGALDTAYFDEGLLVGYRWYDAHEQAPLFPFGHGLTYSDMRIENVALTDAAVPTLKATVRNAGRRDDAETLQVYLAFPQRAGEPPQRLATFAKVSVPAGEQRSVELAIPPTALQIWDETARGWRDVSGKLEIMLGRSSRDIVFRTSVNR